MSQPLDGLLVVALEQAVAAPFCTALLADAGARVIKIERDVGDFARGYDDVVNGESSYFVWLNRGKESVCLDIKSERDKELMLRMLARADVFVQNLAPGAAARAGFDSSALRKKDDKLITLDISGYGESGPYKDMKAYDLLVQCESGLASVTGLPDGPGRVGVSICDIACGMYANAAVLRALLERQQTGSGQGLKVSLFDAMADWMSVPLLHQDYAGVSPRRVGLNHPSIAPYGAYNCRDGTAYEIAIQNNREWSDFCTHVLQQEQLAVDLRFATNVQRCANREAMNAEIDGVISSLDGGQLRERLDAGRIAFAAVNSVADLSKHPQLRRTSVDTPNGVADIVAPPAISTQGQPDLGAVPGLGEHSDAVRREFSDSASSGATH